MPIRLNLLAEAQAAEEMRRRDPVKRALWIAAILVAITLAWAGSLQFKTMAVKGDLAAVEERINLRTNEYRKVVSTQKQVADINQKLIALHVLATNRFLHGNLLNAMQTATVDEIQLSRLRVEQSYLIAEEIKTKTNAGGITKMVTTKPASITEKISLTLEGTDSSASPGDQVTRFKEVLANNQYFRENLSKTNQVNLKSLSAPQISPNTGRAIVLFSLETTFPQRTR